MREKKRKDDGKQVAKWQKQAYFFCQQLLNVKSSIKAQILAEWIKTQKQKTKIQQNYQQKCFSRLYAV